MEYDTNLIRRDPCLVIIPSPRAPCEHTVKVFGSSEPGYYLSTSRGQCVRPSGEDVPRWVGVFYPQGILF